MAALLVLAAPATSSRWRGGESTDASFNPSAASIDVGYALAVQRDGRIVLAGLSRRGGRYDFALARYRASGRLDSSFGTGGLVLTAFARGGTGAAAIAEQPDGKLVVAGGTNVSENQSVFAVGRYTRRGDLDATFGRGGKVVTAFATPRPGMFSVASVGGVALQRDGRIVVAGASGNLLNVTQVALARYTKTGRLDATFGKGGKAVTDLGSRHSAAARAIALQRDRKIVVAGWSNVPARDESHFTVARFTSRGTIDRGFGSRGRLVTLLGYWSVAGDVAIQADGKIVVAGSVHVPRDGIQLGLVRYLPNARLDTSFGIDGTVLTNFAVRGEPAIVIQADGKIVAACGLGSPRRFGLARYDRDGTLDPTFGEGGKVRMRFPADSAARAVALQRDGKIVAAGSSGGDFALARYTADGTVDKSFGTDGIVTTPLGPAWLRRAAP